MKLDVPEVKLCTRSLIYLYAFTRITEADNFQLALALLVLVTGTAEFMSVLLISFTNFHPSNLLALSVEARSSILHLFAFVFHKTCFRAVSAEL